MAVSAGSGRLLLADKSVLARGVEEIAGDDELCVCAVTRLEVLYSARSAEDYAKLEAELDSFRELRMDAETFTVALGAQRELAERSQHRVPIPDLLVAACAHQHGAGVVHLDRHYDLLATVLTIDVVRLPS